MMENKILIFDSNETRGKNILTLLNEVGLSATHYKQFNGENIDNLTGIWNDQKENFKKCIQSFKYIFMHYSNDQFSNALSEIPEDKLVIIYSGGGNVTLNNTNENIYAFQGKVSDDAKTEWDLGAFAEALQNGDNIFEALQSVDPKLEKLLEPFATANPFKTNDTLKQAKVALNECIKSMS